MVLINLLSRISVNVTLRKHLNHFINSSSIDQNVDDMEIIHSYFTWPVFHTFLCWIHTLIVFSRGKHFPQWRFGSKDVLPLETYRMNVAFFVPLTSFFTSNTFFSHYSILLKFTVPRRLQKTWNLFYIIWETSPLLAIGFELNVLY